MNGAREKCEPKPIDKKSGFNTKEEADEFFEKWCLAQGFVKADIK